MTSVRCPKDSRFAGTAIAVLTGNTKKSIPQILDLSDGMVKVTVIGKILDEKFAEILIENPNLSLDDILIFDNVQKRKSITDEEYK